MFESSREHCGDELQALMASTSFDFDTSMELLNIDPHMRQTLRSFVAK